MGRIRRRKCVNMGRSIYVEGRAITCREEEEGGVCECGRSMYVEREGEYVKEGSVKCLGRKSKGKCVIKKKKNIAEVRKQKYNSCSVKKIMFVDMRREKRLKKKNQGR